MGGWPPADTPLWVDPGTRWCPASAWLGVRAPKHFRGLCSLAGLQSCPLSLHALGGPRRPGRKKTPAPSGPLSREVTTAWLGPLLYYVVPALLLRALRGQLTAPQPASLLRQEPHPRLLRGPVACRSVPGPWAGPAAFLQRLAEEEATGRAGRCLPEGPQLPGGRAATPAVSNQPPPTRSCKLSLVLRVQKCVASTGSLGPAPGASPALVGADPLHRAGTPPSPPVAWR